MYNKDLLKEELTRENIVEIIESIGGKPHLRNETVVCDTICHNHRGEGSSKLYYYDNTKLFKCYTGCGEYFDIFELVIKAYEIQYNQLLSLPQAMQYVAEVVGLTHLQEEDLHNLKLDREDWDILKRYEIKEGHVRTQELSTIECSCLKILPQPIIAPWLNEGISRETMKRFGIRYYPLECQIVIPHWNDQGLLVGVRGRTLVQEDAEKFGKYRPLIIGQEMYNHPLGMYLYGLNFTKENIRKARTAVVFESEKAVMMYDSYFGSENNISVACCGSSISSFQIQLLIDAGAEEIIIAFDRQFKECGDAEFNAQTKNLQRIVDKHKNTVKMSCIFDKGCLLEYKDSPIDRGKEIFTQMVQERIIF